MKNSRFVPVLRVNSARKSAQFYADNLGFATDWEHQFEANFPLFISMSLGTLQLFLSEHKGSGMDNAELYVYVDDVDSLYHQLTSKGTRVEQPPTTQPWGVRDMKLQDLDGHRFIFASKLS